MSEPISVPLDQMVSSHSAHTADAAVSRLRRALQTTATVSAAPTDALWAAICGYVDELKNQGLSPERALISVKRVIGDIHGVRADDERRRFVQQVISWCIEAYYRPR